MQTLRGLYAPTGYGQQIDLFAPRLAEEYEVAISAFYGLEGARLKYNADIPVLPNFGQNFGNEALPGHANRFFAGEPRGGFIFTLMDVWVLDAPMLARHNTICWTPVDHDPAPPMVQEFFKRSGAVPIAMSRFGQERLREWSALYCPHAVDTSVFKPMPQAECRKMAGFPADGHVIGCVAANKGWPSRKCFPQLLEAFSIFRERHDDAILYLHTEPHGKCEGVNIPVLLKALGLTDGSVLLTDEYRYNYEPYAPELMARVYNAMDVLLAPSMGEGFGLATLEAGACGVPAIVSDFATSPEILGAGWTVEGRRVWTKQASWAFDPSVEDLVEALNRSYAAGRAEREQLAATAVTRAQEYEIGKVVREHMLPALAEATERFEGNPKLEIVAA